MSTEPVKNTEFANSTPPNIRMATATQHDLAAELGKLRASNNSGPMDRRIAAFGILLSVAGLVVILVCFAQSRDYADLRDQLDALILGLFGIGLILLGCALYLRSAITRFLRYWLLRMVYEQRDLARTSTETESQSERD